MEILQHLVNINKRRGEFVLYFEKRQSTTSGAMIAEAWLLLDFYRDDFLSLRAPPFSRAQAYDYLTRQVSRHPKNLSYHVGRIQAAVNQDEEAVYASLVDLILVLGNRGISLQRRLIYGARSYLSQERYDLVRRHISGHASYLPFSHRCVVHDGRWGWVDWKLEDPHVKSSELDLFQAAQDCLGMGQVDQAREILEGLVAEDPENTEVRRALLEIFRATHDTQRFSMIYKLLREKDCLDEGWRRTFYEWEPDVHE